MYIKDNQLFSETTIRLAHPNTSFPAYMLPEHVVELGYVPLILTPKPDDTATHKYIESDPVSGTQVWIAIEKTQAEIDAEAFFSETEAAASTAKLDPVIAYLTRHTPAQCEKYVQDNVTDLASAKSLLKKYAIALCALAHREFG